VKCKRQFVVLWSSGMNAFTLHNIMDNLDSCIWVTSQTRRSWLFYMCIFSTARDKPRRLVTATGYHHRSGDIWRRSYYYKSGVGTVRTRADRRTSIPLWRTHTFEYPRRIRDSANCKYTKHRPMSFTSVIMHKSDSSPIEHHLSVNECDNWAVPFHLSDALSGLTKHIKVCM
jgi:hypothetical protein